MIKKKKLLICEVLKQANEKENRQDIIDFLRTYDTSGLRIILSYAFDDSRLLAVSDDLTDFKFDDLPPGCQYSTLEQESNKIFKYFDHESAYANLMGQQKRDKTFCKILERVQIEDAKLLLAVKDKQLKTIGNTKAIYKNITADLVDEAFPGLLKEFAETAQEPSQEPLQEPSQEPPVAVKEAPKPKVTKAKKTKRKAKSKGKNTKK